jgi:ribosome-binding factor A
MSRENPRSLRVAAELQRVANELLAHEIGDPRLSGVRISSVEVSGDLSLARLFFNTLDPDDDPAPAADALVRAAGFFRSRLGRAVRLRRVPELRFVHDISARRGMEMSQLIDSALGGATEPQTDLPDDVDE